MAAGKFSIERDNRLEIIRDKELKKIQLAVDHQEYILVSSSPQSGLTTFFSQAISQMKSQTGVNSVVPVYIIARDLEEPFFVYLAIQVAKYFIGEVKNLSYRKKKFAEKEKEGIEALFQAAFGKSNQGSIVFFIDEFHTLPIEQQRLLVCYMRQLHSYRPQSSYLHRIIFVLGGTLRWQSIDPQRISPFSNAASKVVLQDLTREDTAFFVSRFFARHHCRISEISCEYIYEVTQGHCYLTTALCKTIISLAPSEVRFQQIDKAVHDLIVEGDNHLHNFRRKICALDDYDIKPLLDIMEGKVIRRSGFSPDLRIENLILLGVLCADKENRLRLRNSLYTKFLRRDPFFREKIASATHITPDEFLCDHIISANKQAYSHINRIENELRNFLVSKLYQEFQDQWEEKGLGILTTEPERDGGGVEKKLDKVLRLRQKKEQMDVSLPYTEDPIIGYATFKELENIVVKHWKKIFKAIIISQDRFKVYLTTLNRIRNKLAHNRRVTDQDITKIEEIETSFKGWLGGPL